MLFQKKIINITTANPITNDKAPLSLSFLEASRGISSIVVYISAPPASAITYGSISVNNSEIITVIIPRSGINAVNGRISFIRN